MDGVVLPGSEFVCAPGEPAAWASESPAGNKSMRELLIKAATGRAYLTGIALEEEGVDLWKVDEAKLGAMSRLLHQTSDR